MPIKIQNNVVIEKPNIPASGLQDLKDVLQDVETIPWQPLCHGWFIITGVNQGCHLSICFIESMNSAGSWDTFTASIDIRPSSPPKNWESCSENMLAASERSCQNPEIKKKSPLMFCHCITKFAYKYWMFCLKYSWKYICLVGAYVPIMKTFQMHPLSTLLSKAIKSSFQRHPRGTLQQKISLPSLFK